MSDRMPPWMQRARETAALVPLPEADASRLLAAATALTLRDEQAVFARGDAARTVYLVLSGSVRISTTSASGKRVTVEIFQRGELFGEIAVLDSGVRTADATAMGPSDLVSIPATSFTDVLERSAPLANAALRAAITRLRRTYTLLEDASLRTLEARFARQVLYLAKLGTVDGAGGTRLRARMHQDELADLLGVTTRSIINVLNKWREDGLVLFDGRMAQLTIVDADRFAALTEE